MTVSNPFHPSFAAIPPIFLDREKIIGDIIQKLNDPENPCQTITITGISGVGKTVLLNAIVQEIRKDKNWIQCTIPCYGDISSQIVSDIYWKSDLKLKAEMNGILSGTCSSAPSSERLLEQMLQILDNHHLHLLIGLDEVTNCTPVNLFLSIYKNMLEKEYPIFCIFCGLPGYLGKVKSLMDIPDNWIITLPFINLETAESAYLEAFASNGISISGLALHRMTDLSKGFSYSFQLLGHLLWEETEKENISEISLEIINQVLPEYQRIFFRGSCEPVFRRLSSNDQKYIRAMVRYPQSPVPSDYIHSSFQTGKKIFLESQNRLEKLGMISVLPGNYIKLAYPLLDDYLRLLQAWIDEC